MRCTQHLPLISPSKGTFFDVQGWEENALKTRVLLENTKRQKSCHHAPQQSNPDQSTMGASRIKLLWLFQKSRLLLAFLCGMLRAICGPGGAVPPCVPRKPRHSQLRHLDDGNGRAQLFTAKQLNLYFLGANTRHVYFQERYKYENILP